jgi:uncharacterized protein YbjT (DUF2867 family)
MSSQDQPIDDLFARLNARRRKASTDPLHRVLITESQSSIGRLVMRMILKHHSHVHIHAGVANVDEIKLNDFNDILDDDLSYPARIHFLSTPINQSNNQSVNQSLIRAFKDVDAAFIIPDQSNVQSSGQSYIQAAKQAQTKFVCLFGIIDSAQSHSDCMKLKFASVYQPLEQALADTGLPHCVLRAPFMLDDFVSIHLHTIKRDSSFSTPVHGDKRMNYIAQSDFAEAAARVLTDPKEKHEMATYAVLGKGTMTYQSIADCLTEYCHRTIKYSTCSDAEMSTKLKQAQIDPSLIDGLIEQYHEHEKELSHLTEEADDFQSIVGRQPQSYQEYLKAVAPRFKQ